VLPGSDLPRSEVPSALKPHLVSDFSPQGTTWGTSNGPCWRRLSLWCTLGSSVRELRGKAAPLGSGTVAQTAPIIFALNSLCPAE
jgi:hypothetical protein